MQTFGNPEKLTTRSLRNLAPKTADQSVYPNMDDLLGSVATAVERIRKIAQPNSADGPRLEDDVNPHVYELTCENADLAGSCGFDGLNLCANESLNPSEQQQTSLL